MLMNHILASVFTWERVNIQNVSQSTSAVSAAAGSEVCARVQLIFTAEKQTILCLLLHEKRLQSIDADALPTLPHRRRFTRKVSTELQLEWFTRELQDPESKRIQREQYSVAAAAPRRLAARDCG